MHQRWKLNEYLQQLWSFCSHHESLRALHTDGLFNWTTVLLQANQGNQFTDWGMSDIIAECGRWQYVRFQLVSLDLIISQTKHVSWLQSASMFSFDSSTSLYICIYYTFYFLPLFTTLFPLCGFTSFYCYAFIWTSGSKPGLKNFGSVLVGVLFRCNMTTNHIIWVCYHDFEKVKLLLYLSDWHVFKSLVLFELTQ